jgi:hypothetical protein
VDGTCRYVKADGTCSYVTVDGTGSYFTVDGTANYVTVDGTVSYVTVYVTGNNVTFDGTGSTKMCTECIRFIKENYLLFLSCMFTRQQFEFAVMCCRQYAAVRFVLCYTVENNHIQ